MAENQQEIIDRNKELIKNCIEKYDLPVNPNIDKELLLFKNFPKNVSLKLVFVILMYKKEFENRELGKYSNQAAATIRELSKVGFIFQQNETGYNTYFNEDKKRVRKIISLVKNISSTSKKNNKTKNKPIKDSQAISQTFINDISIKDFFCIQDLEIKDIAGNKEVYILGENGDGKSLLLQAIILGLKGFFIKNRANITPSVGYALQLLRDAEPQIEVGSTDNHSFSIDGNMYLENIFAYGVNRGRKNAKNSDEYGFGSLFGDEVYLKDPTEWLLEVDRLNARDFFSIKLDAAIKMIEELLDNNVKISVKKDVIFEERGTEIKFEQLSEGYKNVITWIVDLLARLSETQYTVNKIQNFEGIVLVDEIGLHLHPKWEYSIIKKLRTWFPKIQFIFTTHSPVTILGASSDAVFYRIYKEDGITKVDEPFYADKISNWMVNIVITSPLFDLDSARMRAFDVQNEELDTSQDFIYHRIHKEISKEVEQIKQTGKTHIPINIIEKMIADAIEKHKV